MQVTIIFNTVTCREKFERNLGQKIQLPSQIAHASIYLRKSQLK